MLQNGLKMDDSFEQDSINIINQIQGKINDKVKRNGNKDYKEILQESINEVEKELIEKRKQECLDTARFY